MEGSIYPEDECEWPEDEEYEEAVLRNRFADPGGNSALHCATKKNPRIYKCLNCGKPNKLTKLDLQSGYQCDQCADRLEHGYDF